ncbi:MAG: SGNH/GDSL hydrolase family protein [Leptospiraceae bacterium]|nr:SGNH/GDSL hydrolase family protein [Leptospiraceae bacterium]
MKKFFLLILFLLGCDSPKSFDKGLQIQLFCRVLVTGCETGRPTKFGMIGDSWTDLVLGTDAIESLRVQLEKYHGYKIIGSTLGGQLLETALKQNLHFKVIEEAGPDIKYMLLSLGGNDILGNISRYNGRIEEEKAIRFSTIRSSLSQMIQQGNAYKVSKWGGAPLIWMIHGYDYANPDVPSLSGSTFCRQTLLDAGFTTSTIETLSKNLDDLNSLYIQITTTEPQLKYIDLRRTLGGPPYSNPANMFDCIHPNSIGFRIIGERYAKAIEGQTNGEK